MPAKGTGNRVVFMKKSGPWTHCKITAFSHNDIDLGLIFNGNGEKLKFGNLRKFKFYLMNQILFRNASSFINILKFVFIFQNIGAFL